MMFVHVWMVRNASVLLWLPMRLPVLQKGCWSTGGLPHSAVTFTLIHMHLHLYTHKHFVPFFRQMYCRTNSKVNNNVGKLKL